MFLVIDPPKKNQENGNTGNFKHIGSVVDTEEVLNTKREGLANQINNIYMVGKIRLSLQA